MSTRWCRGGGPDAGDRYQARFDAAAARGESVHGEVDLVTALVPASARVLDAGCGTGRVAIELARRGYDVVGVDSDAAMLAIGRRRAPDLPWVEADLAELSPDDSRLGGRFGAVVAAGNVIPLVQPGAAPAVVETLAATLRPGGLMIAGFGLDESHLPLDEAPVTLEEYDAWCAAAGLRRVYRWATWEEDAFHPGGGYAVSVHVSHDGFGAAEEVAKP